MFFFFRFAVGQDGGGGAADDALHGAALPVQVPRVSKTPLELFSSRCITTFVVCSSKLLLSFSLFSKEKPNIKDGTYIREGTLLWQYLFFVFLFFVLRNDTGSWYAAPPVPWSEERVFLTSQFWDHKKWRFLPYLPHAQRARVQESAVQPLSRFSLNPVRDREIRSLVWY